HIKIVITHAAEDELAAGVANERHVYIRVLFPELPQMLVCQNASQPEFPAAIEYRTHITRHEELGLVDEQVKRLPIRRLPGKGGSQQLRNQQRAIEIPVAVADRVPGV